MGIINPNIQILENKSKLLPFYVWFKTFGFCPFIFVYPALNKKKIYIYSLPISANDPPIHVPKLSFWSLLISDDWAVRLDNEELCFTKSCSVSPSLQRSVTRCFCALLLFQPANTAAFNTCRSTNFKKTKHTSTDALSNSFQLGWAENKHISLQHRTCSTVRLNTLHFVKYTPLNTVYCIHWIDGNGIKLYCLRKVSVGGVTECVPLSRPYGPAVSVSKSVSEFSVHQNCFCHRPGGWSSNRRSGFSFTLFIAVWSWWGFPQLNTHRGSRV